MSLREALRRLPCILLDWHPVPPQDENTWMVTPLVRPRCPRCGRALIPDFFGPGWVGLPDDITAGDNHG